MTQLVLRGLSRTFAGRGPQGAVVALQPTDLAVSRGEFVAILGPSGCGKSTLLRIVAGLDRPSSGEVRLDGRLVVGPGPERGMVFQSYTLFPWLTVEENIRFGLVEAGMAVGRQREVAAGLIERVGLRGFERHWPRQLSGGMQQRVALARALAPGPSMLLLDEPFGALDHQTRELMQELLAEVWLGEGERKTVLFVTHDIDEAIFLAGRVLVMSARPGRVKVDVPVGLGWPRDYRVKTGAAFVALKARLTEEIRAEVRAGAVQ